MNTKDVHICRSITIPIFFPPSSFSSYMHSNGGSHNIDTHNRTKVITRRGLQL